MNVGKLNNKERSFFLYMRQAGGLRIQVFGMLEKKTSLSIDISTSNSKWPIFKGCNPESPGKLLPVFAIWLDKLSAKAVGSLSPTVRDTKLPVGFLRLQEMP